MWVSTDVDDFAQVMREVARVLLPDGSFLFYGAHPCFNGPCVENRSDGSRVVHPAYRQARRHTESPWWSPHGIRTKVDGMRHLHLAELMGAIVDAGLNITRVVEPGEEAVPHALVVTARRAMH